MRKNEIELDISLNISLNCSIKNFLDEKETLITITIDESILDDEIEFKKLVDKEIRNCLIRTHLDDYYNHNQKRIDDFQLKRKHEIDRLVTPVGSIYFMLAVELERSISFDVTKIVVRQKLQYSVGE